MRKFFSLAFLCALMGPLAVAGLSGCQMPCSTAGWRFEYLKPATVNAPAAVSAGPGPLGVVPLTASAGIQPSPVQIVPRQAMMAAVENPCTPSGSGGSLAAAPGCDLNAVCASLHRIEQRLASQSQPAPMPRQMPAGQP